MQPSKPTKTQGGEATCPHGLENPHWWCERCGFSEVSNNGKTYVCEKCGGSPTWCVGAHVYARVPASSPTPARTAGEEAKPVRYMARGECFVTLDSAISEAAKIGGVVTPLYATPAVRTGDDRGCDIPQALMERVVKMREAIFGTASDQNDNPSPSFTLLKLRQVLDDVLAAEASEDK